MSQHGWPILSAAQLRAFYQRIQLFGHYGEITSVTGLDDDTKLSLLTALHKHALVRIPFENLTQHYSWHRVVNVQPLHVLRKITTDQSGSGRGGYCMETNVLLHVVFLSLGFDCYLVGSRVYLPEKDTWAGLTHLVPIVTIGGAEYMVDIAYGPRQPVRPHPLCHEAVMPHIAPAEGRVVRARIPQHLSRKEMWLYQHRIDEHAPWVTIYSIADVELLVNDIEVLNYSPWKDRTGIFAKQVLCARFSTKAEYLVDPLSPTRDKLEGYDLDGTITISHDVFMWRRHGTVVKECKFSNEAERVLYLQTYFGITLPQEDVDAIVNTSSAIQSVTGT